MIPIRAGTRGLCHRSNPQVPIEGDKLITTTTFNSEEIQSQPLVLRTVDDGGLFTDTEFNLSVLPPNRAPTITTRESMTIDEDGFFRMATSGENVLKFDDDATANEEVEVTFTVTEGGIYFFKNNGITYTDGEPGTGYVKFRGDSQERQREDGSPYLQSA